MNSFEAVEVFGFQSYVRLQVQGFLFGTYALSRIAPPATCCATRRFKGDIYLLRVGINSRLNPGL